MKDVIFHSKENERDLSAHCYLLATMSNNIKNQKYPCHGLINTKVNLMGETKEDYDVTSRA